MKQRSFTLVAFAVAALLGLVAVAVAETEPDLEGIFGLSDVDSDAALAFWVPLDHGGAVSGLRWFNNDENVVFPEILAVAGSSDFPELISDATVVCTGVSGGSLSWSGVEFESPLVTDADGIYLIWRLPDQSVFTHAGIGGGAGFGFHAGGEFNQCWITNGNGQWEALTTDHQMAVEPILATEKSGDFVFLQCPTHEAGDLAESDSEDTPALAADRLTVSPNPFNPSTEVRFNLPHSCDGNIAIYDVKGRLVRQLFDGYLSEGPQSVRWDGNSVRGVPSASGVYFVRVRFGEFLASQSMTLAK